MAFNAFDALMSAAHAAAHAAAAKRKPPLPSSSSRKKRKPVNSHKLPPSQNPSNLKRPETVQQQEETITNREPPTKVHREATVSLSESELKERVSLLKKKPSQFNPCSVSWWKENEPVPFLFLSMAFGMIEDKSGRIMITDIMCNLLRTVIHTTPEDLVFVIYLSAGRISPPYKGLELGIGDDSIIKALADACGRTKSQIKQLLKDEGDLGEVAKASRLCQSMLWKPNPLTIRMVFNTFHLIAKASGKNSEEKKKNHIKSLLLAATDCEPLYLVRLLRKKLRIGCAEQTLLAALSQAAVYTEQHSKPPPDIQSPLEEAEKIVKQVYSVLPDYDKLVSALLRDGVWLLPKTCNFTPGVPVGPMLSKPIKGGVSEALEKLQDVEITCEYKYDGERAHIHYMENGSVEIYSRNAKRNTIKFPDVVDAVSRLKKRTVSSFVLDCELVAYDRARQKILPFQVLSTRANKNVAVSDIKVNVCIFAFDLLYLNGQALLQENLKIRREHLYASFEEESGFLQFATSITSNDAEEILKFLDEAVCASCEGLIMKTLNEDATYEPSQRLNWLKLKKDYLDNIGDTLDLVPIGAIYGKGNRGKGYGSFLLACYDSNNDEFQTISMTGVGFTEKSLGECLNRLRTIPKADAYYRYGAKIKPDVWFEASEVWEVKASDLTISPKYQAAAGIVDLKKGISLRMPRLVRFRDDKTPKQATTSEQVAEMFNAQKNTSKMTNEDNRGSFVK